MWYYVIGMGLVVFLLQFVADWLLFKLRGKARADDEKSPIVTCEQDARAQRLIDISQFTGWSPEKKK